MEKRTKGNNTGKNEKSQAARAKNQHKGKVQIKYEEDPNRRAQLEYKRKPTIFKKMEELHVLTGIYFEVDWKSRSGNNGTFSTNKHAKSKHFDETSTENTTEAMVKEPVEPALYPPPPEAGPSTQAIDPSDIGDCAICLRNDISKTKKELRLNCEFRKGCNHWVHCLCIGVVAKCEQDLVDIKFFCPEHILK